MHLRCGSCGVTREVLAGNHTVAAFDRVIDADMDTISAAAERLERESFAAQADSFGVALRLDLLSADDFR